MCEAFLFAHLISRHRHPLFILETSRPNAAQCTLKESLLLAQPALEAEILWKVNLALVAAITFQTFASRFGFTERRTRNESAKERLQSLGPTENKD